MRVKGGVVSRRRHKRMLKLASGMRGRRGNCFRLAKLAVQHGLVYAYRDRKVRKRAARALWVVRLNAGCRQCGISYSRFIFGLKKAGIEIDRRVLSDMAAADPLAFAAVADKAKAALA